MGLVLVVLDTATAWDALPDPVGWALVLPAVAWLPADLRRLPLAAGIAAGLLSLLVWPPAGRDLVAGLDPSVDWLLLVVPDLAFGAALCWSLGRAARAGVGDRAARRAAGVWPSLGFLFAVAALGPAPFLATDRAVPGDLAFLAQVCWLVLIALLFAWNKASWAPTRRPAEPAAE